MGSSPANVETDHSMRGSNISLAPSLAGDSETWPLNASWCTTLNRRCSPCFLDTSSLSTIALGFTFLPSTVLKLSRLYLGAPPHSCGVCTHPGSLEAVDLPLEPYSFGARTKEVCHSDLSKLPQCRASLRDIAARRDTERSVECRAGAFFGVRSPLRRWLILQVNRSWFWLATVCLSSGASSLPFRQGVCQPCASATSAVSVVGRAGAYHSSEQAARHHHPVTVCSRTREA
jgi:hypothetical protein